MFRNSVHGVQFLCLPRCFPALPVSFEKSSTLPTLQRKHLLPKTRHIFRREKTSVDRVASQKVYLFPIRVRTV